MELKNEREKNEQECEWGEAFRRLAEHTAELCKVLERLKERGIRID